MKNKYRGVFNYQRSVLEPLYRHATTARQAWFLMTGAIADMQGVDARIVRNYFPWVEGGKSINYEISTETEYIEVIEDDIA